MPDLRKAINSLGDISTIVGATGAAGPTGPTGGTGGTGGTGASGATSILSTRTGAPTTFEGFLVVDTAAKKSYAWNGSAYAQIGAYT